MRFLCDEGVERQIVTQLRADGHAVLYVAELSPGISDEEVLGLSALEGATLMTSDKDFGELVFRQRRAAAGVILLRLSGLGSRSKADTVAAVVTDLGERLLGSFSVIEPSRVRVRSSTIGPSTDR